MKRVAVVTSTPLFVEGGHLVIARALVQALREEGHEATMVLTPQNRFGRQGAAYLATWLTDVGMATTTRPSIRSSRSGIRATPSAIPITSSG